MQFMPLSIQTASVRKSSRLQLRWESYFARIIWILSGASVFGGVYCKQEAVSAEHISRYLTKSVEMADGSLTFHNVTLFLHRFDGSWKKRKQIYDIRKKQIISSLILNAFFFFPMRATYPIPYLSL
jgi:hypothetical protein